MTNIARVNEVFGLVGHITVMSDGFINFNGRGYTPREAVDIATALLVAAQASQWREQVGTTHFHSTEQILRRQDSPLGKAVTAARHAL